MNHQPNEQSAGMPAWYDPFQEIRTMPKGWDLSSLLAGSTRRVAPTENDGFDQDTKSETGLELPDPS